MMKKLFTAALLLLSALTTNIQAEENHLVGGDISLLPRYEQYKTPYYTPAGQSISDVLLYLRDVCGMNAMRVRLFVNPNTAQAKEGVVQDLDYVTKLGKRIKDAGLKFLLDFHYSDTWADPSQQKLPAAWSDCKTPAEKAQRLYTYTRESLEALTAAGATPDYVQVGNEISYGMIGIQVHPYDQAGDDWEGLLAVLAQGCKAVREVCPDAKIIIHTERAAKASETVYFYQKLETLDYDIIGLSYYPIWHAPLSTLSGTLDTIATSFPAKQVHVVETAYNYRYWPNSGVKYNTQSTWPCSAEGQQKFAQDLVQELGSHPNVTGLYWWFPEENGNGGPSYNASTIVINGWLNRGLWDNENHKALPALFELKGFLSGSSRLDQLDTVASDVATFDLLGREQKTTLTHGFGVRQGQKFYQQ